MKNWKQTLVLAALACAPVSAQTVFNGVPTTIVGQPILQQSGTLTAVAPNLVEGRELNSPQSVAVDTSSGTPIVYIADTGNNRVLGFKNATSFSNGAKADLVIGQRDFLSTSAKGPGSDLTTGLASPTAVLVDGSGNLYVADAGNNRILRYPKPFQQTGDLLTVDLVIGQTDINGRSSNQGLTQPTEKTLALTSTNGAFRIGMTAEGNNLWVSDSGNNRVLRYNGLLGQSNPTNAPAADLVIGQSDFNSNSIVTGAVRNGKNFLSAPSALVFDQGRRLFVADGQSRVMVYAPPFSSGMLASRILGIVLPTAQNPNPRPISESTLGGSAVGPPEGLFVINNNLYVVDTGNNRILRYDPYDVWLSEQTAFSQPARGVFGQVDFFTGTVNKGQAQPSADSLSTPVQAAVANNVVYLVDSGNHRVLSIPVGSDGSLLPATKVLGQIDFKYNTVNFIEGREFFFLLGFSNSIAVGGGSLVIDNTSTPPHLYVSDTLNNRILGFSDYRKLMAGTKADLVIGQTDFFSSQVNSPSNDLTIVSDKGLAAPQGIAVDSAGNLFVADSGNGRVLRFPRPFDVPAGIQPTPNLVIGQSGFFSKVTDASASTMSRPNGLAFASDGSLVVSDSTLNRVLYFRKPKGGDFSNGQAAVGIFGQPTFGPPTGTSLSSPHGVTIDVDDRLYVADTGNNRIVVYPNVGQAGIDPPISFSITNGLSSDTLRAPHSVYSDPFTAALWVTDTLNNRILRYPKFQELANNPVANTSLATFAPLGVTVDPFGNPLSAEGSTNRVAFFSPAIDFTSAAGGVSGRFSGNGANYFQRFAPGMLASIFAFTTSRFGDTTTTFDALPKPLPIPTTLGDVQVTVAGVPAPLLYVSPNQINFQVPIEVQPGSTPQEIRVTRASTSQILASSFFRIDPASPGLFTSNSTGSGQLAVLNEDNTVNSATKPAKAGTVIQIFGTGTGLVTGNPADGVPASGILPTDETPQVFINNAFIPQTDVLYSGLAPGFVGVWQINARVPKDAPPGDVPLFVVYKGENSNLDQFGTRRLLTIRTAPLTQ